jgi:hypothetical protein
MAHASVVDIDTLEVRTAVQTDFSAIAGFLFHWDFANPGAEKYDRSSKLLMSFLVGYMLVVFSLYLKFDAESFTQILLLVVGVTGVFASNPLTYSFRPGPGAHISDHIFMPAFQAVLEFFLLCQLELLCRHATSPRPALLVVLAVFFAFYATVQAAATYDRQAHVLQAEREVHVVLQTELALVVLDAIFALAALVYFVVAAVANEGVNPHRVALFGVSLPGVIGTTLVAEVYFVLAGKDMCTIIPSPLTSSTHITFAAIDFFLLHTGGGRQYDAIPDQAKTQAEAIDFEPQSDGGVSDDESDEEEEGDDIQK